MAKNDSNILKDLFPNKQADTDQHEMTVFPDIPVQFVKVFEKHGKKQVEFKFETDTELYHGQFRPDQSLQLNIHTKPGKMPKNKIQVDNLTKFVKVLNTAQHIRKAHYEKDES